MDCEKFEPLLLDELYDELDELTSAAVKRHASGCARCSGILAGFRSTRCGIALPLVDVPDGLEDRILAAAREAQKVVPIRSPFSRALSVAGSWAMRPQTAMAAVFLLMLGTSAVLVRSKNHPSGDSAVSVTVAGEPAPTAAPAAESLDDKAAAAAHGPSSPPNIARLPPASAPAAPVAIADEVSGIGAAKGKSAEPRKDLGDNDDLSGSLPGAPAATARPQDQDGYASQSAAKPYATKRAGPEPQDPSSLGAAAFRARNFAEAAKQYDIAAQAGDTNAELWAAESTSEGQGCAVALGRFDRLASRAAGQWVGNEASLKAARCQLKMGQLDGARERLDRLAQVPSHQQAAQTALGELNNQIAARRSAGPGAAGGAVAAPKRAVSPAARPAPAPRPPATAESSPPKNSSGY